MSTAHSYPAAFTVAEGKVARYLLNLQHAGGGSKGGLLLRFGFSPERPLELMDALAAHPSPERLSEIVEAPFGVKFYFYGPLASPDGRNPSIRTVWQIDYEGDGKTARFITIRPTVPAGAHPVSDGNTALN